LAIKFRLRIQTRSREIFSIFAEAANCLIKAIDIYTDMGRFTVAAKHHQTVAEMYEGDGADLDKAMKHYEQAADYFRVSEISYPYSVFSAFLFSNN